MDNSGSTPPELAIVLVEPDTVPWHKTPLFKPFFMKWLSEGIATLDKGPFSHSVLRNGEKVIDARLRKTAVLESDFACLVCLRRGLAFMVHQPDRDRAILDAWAWVKHQYPESVESEQNQFTFLGLLRIGILLIIETEGWPARLGRWLVDHHRDDPGVFCSELIASALAGSGHELVVTVPANRIPAKGSPEEAALLRLLTARRAINMPGADDQVEAATNEAAMEAFAAQLDRLRTGIEGPTRDVPVGGPDPDRATYPPSLVTPNDLYRSSSLVYRGDEDGYPYEPPWSDEEWAKRYRTWKRVTAGVAVVSLLVAGLVASVLARVSRRGPRTVTSATRRPS